MLSHTPRRLGALALAIALAAGCAPATAAPTGAPTAAATEVSWMVLGDPAETKSFQDVAAAFEALHPGTTVTVITLASEEAEYFVRLGSDLAAGTPADVVYMDYRDAGRYYANGSFQPIGAQLAASDLIAAKDFYPQALDAFTWEGQQMCLPINISSLVTYYNKALFDAAGLAYPADDWTWENLLTTAQALTKDTDGDGVVDQFGLGTSAQIIRVLPFIWQNDGDFLDGDQLALNTPQALEALQFFVDLHAKHQVTPDRVAETAQSSQARFEHGTLGMFFQSRRVTTAFRSITAFDWDVAPLPSQAQSATILHADGLCIPTQAAHPALAWELIEFANSVRGQQIMSTTGRTVPSNRAVAESEYFLDPNAKPAHSQVWIDVIPGIRSAPVLKDWEEIEEHANEAIEHAYYGDDTAAEAMQAIIAYVEKHLDD